MNNFFVSSIFDIDVNQQRDFFGSTALILASKRGHKEIVQLLLQHKDSDVKRKDIERRTAVMVASSKGHKEIVQLLLDHKELQVQKHCVICVIV